MRLLIVSQYFHPENFRVNDLVSGMVQRGHAVTVLTGQPNYPGGHFFEGYGRRGPREESLLGARVMRVPLVPRGSGRALPLILNYLSFVLTASWAVLFRLRKEYDAIFVFQASPVTVGIPACIAAWRMRVPILFWILDLWPESLRATGVVRSPRLLDLIGRGIAAIYRRCACILVVSKAFFPSIEASGIPKSRIRYFPNWIEAEYVAQADSPASSAFGLPEGFRIVYAGNIGVAQGFPEIIDAAERVAKQAPEVSWVIAGDGRMAEWTKAEVARRGLAERFLFLNQLPPQMMPALFGGADALLVSLRADPVFEMTVPGKVQSYLAAGKPILAMIDGEGARVVREAGAGFACPAGDSAGLARLVLDLAAASPEARKTLGDSGRRYAFDEFERERLFDALDTWFQEETGRKH